MYAWTAKDLRHQIRLVSIYINPLNYYVIGYVQHCGGVYAPSALPPYVLWAISEGELCFNKRTDCHLLSARRKQLDRKLPWKIACSE